MVGSGKEEENMVVFPPPLSWNRQFLGKKAQIEKNYFRILKDIN